MLRVSVGVTPCSWSFIHKHPQRLLSHQTRAGWFWQVLSPFPVCWQGLRHGLEGAGLLQTCWNANTPLLLHQCFPCKERFGRSRKMLCAIKNTQKDLGWWGGNNEMPKSAFSSWKRFLLQILVGVLSFEWLCPVLPLLPGPPALP